MEAVVVNEIVMGLVSCIFGENAFHARTRTDLMINNERAATVITGPPSISRGYSQRVLH
jgi:hypothetical protein